MSCWLPSEEEDLMKPIVPGLLALLTELRIFVEQKPPKRVLKEICALARSNHLSTCDDSHLDLVMRKRIPIASLEKNIVQAALVIKLPIFNH